MGRWRLERRSWWNDRLPPPGDGVFDQFDVISALNQNWYLTPMEFAALVPDGRINDGTVSVVYHAATGEVVVDPPAGLEFTSISVDSAASIFPMNMDYCPGGAIDCDPDSNLFKATFDGSFGFFSFGNVATPLLSEQFLLSELVVIGSFLG